MISLLVPQLADSQRSNIRGIIVLREVGKNLPIICPGDGTITHLRIEFAPALTSTFLCLNVFRQLCLRLLEFHSEEAVRKRRI